MNFLGNLIKTVIRTPISRTLVSNICRNKPVLNTTATTDLVSRFTCLTMQGKD